MYGYLHIIYLLELKAKGQGQILYMDCKAFAYKIPLSSMKEFHLTLHQTRLKVSISG